MLAFLFEFAITLISEAILGKNPKVFVAFLAIVGLMLLWIFLWKA